MPENPKYTPKIDFSLYDPSIEIKNINNPLANLTSTDYYGDAADFGSSKYDDANMSNLNLQTGDYKYIRGEKQSGLAQVGLGVLRAASKAGVEALKTPGYLYSLGEWGVRNAAGEDYTLDKALDNTYINSLENADDYIKKDLLPVYKSYQAEKGSFMEQVLTTSFIGTEVADGVGYLLGMTVGPGLAVQGLGTAAKIARLAQATKIAKLSSKATKIGEGVELGAQTLLNSSVEALAEAKGVSDRFTREMGAMLTPGSPTFNPINPATGQQWTKEEIAKAKADATLETFNANMGVLILPNLIMNKALLGRFGKDKSILDRFRGADGKLVSDPVTKKLMAKEIGKGIAVGVGSEGFLEEGGQTSIENYEINKALGKVPDEFIEGVAKEYLNTLTTTEGKKSILLGALLGGMGTGMGAYRKEKAERARIPAISQMIKNNFTTIGMDSDIFERDENGVIKKDAEGKSVYNAAAVVKATEAFVKESSDAQLKDKALLYDDELLYNYITHNQVTRFMAPFLKEGEIGLEILNEHIDNVSDTRLANDAKTMAESKQDVFNENKHKAELKQKAKKLQSVYESTQEVLSDMPILQELAQDPANSEYLSKFVNEVASAVFQETAKQIFFNNEISKAELERTTNIADMISNDLPLANFLNEKLLDKVGTLNKLVAESKKKYEDALNPEEHLKAFDEYKKEVDNVKKLVELLEKEQTKATTTPATETVTTPTPTPTKTEMEITAENDKIITAKGTLYMVSNLKDFDSVYNTIKDHPLLTDSDKQEFAAKRKELADAEGVTETPVATTVSTMLSSDQDMISDSINNTTAANTEEIKQITSDEIKNVSHDKGINTKINTVMMKLFNHTFIKDIFRWIRNEDGFPTVNNESNISIPELNKLRVGDKVTLKLVPIGLDALTRYQTAKKEAFLKGAKEDVRESDFNDAHIGIYSNGNLIGFVQQPYAIADNAVNKTTALALRQELIAYRKAITTKLKANEEVVEEVTEKGNGNLYTKLNRDGKIDAKFKVFEQARPEDKMNGGLLFGYSDGEKVIFKDSTLTPAEEAEVSSQVSALKYENKGQIFQLVKDLNGKWSVIPVYSSLIEENTIEGIMDVINNKITNSTDPMTVVSELNDFIYASTTRESASVLIDFKNGNLTFKIDGTVYSLEQLKNVPAKQKEFKASLVSKRQNISILKLNDPNFQKTLAKRNTLVTNVTTFEGEYFVQPYVEISHIAVLSEPLNKTTTDAKADIERRRQEKLSTFDPMQDSVFAKLIGKETSLRSSYALTPGKRLKDELDAAEKATIQRGEELGAEINAKYDAELATLDTTDTKADIEEALKDVESTAKALLAISEEGDEQLQSLSPLFSQVELKEGDNWTIKIAEAYHKAKADSSNPKLVEAVESLLSKEQVPTKEEAPTLRDIERKRKEAESKIKRKDLFIGVGEFSSELGGSDKAAVPVSHREVNGIEFVEYAHPETGSIDVIVTGKSDNDFVGFYRIYENGKATNKWSSKFENQSRNKEDFKIMIGGVQEMLPAGHEYTEKTSISTDGLRVWNQQLSRGYELQYDENGKLITNLVAINGDAIVNELGIPVEKGQFENIKVRSKEEFEAVKKALLPYLEKFGLVENDIKWLTGTVKINLPVLKKSELAVLEGKSTTASDAKIDSKIEEIVAKAKKKGLGSPLNNNDALSTTKDITSLDKKAFAKWLAKNLPQLTLSDIDKLSDLGTNITDAFGLFKDLTIYLFEGAGNKTAYHEAFHGVFRNMLSQKQRDELIVEAISRYKAPTESDLYLLQSALKKDYTNEELTYLYYEEKLADEFGEFTNRYNDKNWLQKLGSAISDFFNKILSYFNIFTRNSESAIDSLFDRVNKGKFANKAVNNKRDLASFSTEYAASRDLTKMFGPTQKMNIITSISDEFLAQYQESSLKGDAKKASDIFKNIMDKYVTFVNEYNNDLKDHSEADANVAYHIIQEQNSKDFIKESIKLLSIRGIKISLETDKIDFTGQIEELDENSDDNVQEAKSKETKGLREATSIDGLSSASNRIKLFLSSIPVLNSDKTVKTDVYGIPQYYDFNSLYYFIERNLTGYYTFEDQIQALKELSDNKPQILQVIDLLTNNASNLDKQQFKLLVNDFKTNFSKQQLAYTLVKFDTDSNTGKVKFEIMDANRKSIGLQTQTEWNDNLVNPNNNTITEFKEGEPIVNNTAKAKALYERWTALTARTTPIQYKVASEILSKVGVNYTPSVLQNLLDRKDNVFKDNVTALLKYHATELTDASGKAGREAMKSLVSFETTARFDKFTSSFISADNKNIYTIQLPSFASKMLKKLTGTYAKSMSTIEELQKDPFNANSNLLNELKNNIQFRNNGFKMTYLDGLKDQKGESKGSKFTSMTPKDFFAMEIALFQNTAINAQKIVGDKLSKYVYITPSDKSMSMIFDAKQYEVSLSGDIISLESPILNNYYNVYLQEVARIKHNLEIKNDILANKENSKYKLSDILEHYHVNSKESWKDFSKYTAKQLAGEKLTDQDWEAVSKLFNGAAYKFNYFSEKFHNDNIENLEASKASVVASLRDELTKEYHNVREEMRSKGLIANNNGVWTNIALEVSDANLNQLIASYSTNALLANIDISNLLNGDVAMYKPNDLQKRTYQSQAMFTNSKFEQKTIKTIVKKDVKAKSEVYKDLVDTLAAQGFTPEEIEVIAGDYKGGINVTDAQVFITPAFYKAIHESRGTWTPIMQEAHDIAEGKKVEKLTPEHRRALAGIKPYYFGNRYDTTLGIQRYEQVKCAILPLYKMYTDINPVLANNRAEMESSGAEMLAFESAFKAAIGYRSEITDNNNVIVELDSDNFGIQVDNPDHMDDGNDSMRQLKMLILGSIDSTKEYRGTNGKVIKDRILQMEAVNIRKSLQVLQSKMDVKNNAEFANFVKEMITKRGATINVEEIMNILDGDFEYALDNGSMSSQVENLVSSLFTNHVIKQEFAHGGAAVQATSLGLKFRTLAEQQKNLTANELLVQRELEYVKPDLANGVIGYAECAMPASAKQFFNKDGFLKDINIIPDELKQLIAYRIPFEGLHSALPIRVVKFLPETMGNFILLPYEVTTQLGADFDFDKIYFIGREMYNNNTNNVDTNLYPYKYNDLDTPEALQDRWIQYVNYAIINKEKGMTYEEFKNASIEDQNTRGARNNEIFDNYMKILTSTENLRWMITPSGFTKLAELKARYFSTYKKDNFFSSRTQRDFKYRNHIGIALKGQSALHVSGHSYATLMDLNITTDTLLFNDKMYDSLSGLYSDNGKLVADELASIMAAILDDIKNPLLASLNITNNTIDVLATLIRTGIDMETAIMFISQPGLKELSSLLDVNKNKIKEINQGWFGTSDLINIYYKKLNSLDIYSAKMEYLASTDPESKKDKEVFNITNEDLDKYLHYEIKPKTGKLVIWEQREGSDRKHYTDATEEEQMNYYEYQIKVLNRFDSAKVIADDLVNINKFFGINKEVGPNLEDITTKQYVLNDVIKSKVIEGFDLSKIPALEASYETQMAAQSWFSKYFPYNTGAYQSIKDALFKGQSNKSLSKVPVEDRVFVNNFIRYFTDNDINSPFGNVSQSFNELMLKTPGLLNGIKNFNYKDNKIGNITYDQIRNNSFIKELKTVYDKENGISYIQLQGNRLNLQVKNNVIEGFKALFKNPNTRDLAIKLIEHSFMTSGFFKGVGNYSNLIGPDVLKELGYNDYRKELISGLKNNSVSLEDKKELLIEQLIRNNPKSFTKVFDAAMFEIEDNKALPDIINTSKDLINYANRTQDMIWIDENNIPQNPKYIRVYDKVNKKASIYKKIAPFQYQYLTPLGKSNFIIEVDANNPIIKSNLRANNLLLAKERIPVTEVLEGQEEEIPQSYDDQAYNEAEAAYFESQNPTTDSQEQNMPPISPFLQGLGSKELPDDTEPCQ